VAASRASAIPTEGYGPIESSFSLRSNSYLRRHSLPPAGVTQTCNPPLSVSFYGLSAALALPIWTSVSIGVPNGPIGTLPGFVPGFYRVWTASSGMDGNDSDP
jgi:hypothetical protein